MQNPKPVKLPCAMPMIQQPSRLPLALLISVLVNGALLSGLSFLLESPTVRQPPPAQRLSLNTLSAPFDTARPNQPETAAEMPSQEAPTPKPEPLMPDPEQRPTPQTTATPSESPVIATTREADDATGIDTETDPEVDPANASKLTEDPSNKVTTAPEKETETEHQTPSVSTSSAINTGVSEPVETESATDQDTTVQSESREVLPVQETALQAPEDMNPGAPPNAENLPMARLEHQPELEYPAMAKRRRQQGQVVLRAWLNEQGELEQLSILTSSGHALLDESALEQIKNWTFQSVADGQPHRWVQIPVEFRLR